jgi:hypothetical protein
MLGSQQEEASMHLWIRIAWTAAIVVLVAWPLLFWGKPASPNQDNVEFQTSRSYNSLQRPELFW